ncbi:HK97 gp10 family phage protein [Brevundimonas sp. S30B]|uniref:HK97 gp10 family phage protein n=1 Tax=unclassified Brevundimonas TaxID=2622653 RepID=UPI001072BEBF|nr:MULTISPECIES: HK97 gp10 family phage protein [unclassified Brevundimonas]QBX37223.1 HK97 gp10 family phage protein [Brevundimonas sp. MF30-B]TFW03983.1 HK97 gp10 family phage protein [Brevundimonas sp. S30B]
MKPLVKLEGFKEMDVALGEFSKATARNILRRAGLAALEPVAEVMKDKAPKRREDLRDAIHTGTKRQKGSKKHFPESSTVETYAGVSVVGGGMPPQAIQQEFGNENHGPQPYGRPAWDQEQRLTLERVKDSLGSEIDKARARAQRRAKRAGKG